jgi:hypothetical protein
MNGILEKFIQLGDLYMPFAKDQCLDQANSYQKLVDEGNRAIDHWGEYKIFARFAVRFFCEKNTKLKIVRPLAQKEIEDLLVKDKMVGAVNYDDDLVNIIKKFSENEKQ